MRVEVVWGFSSAGISELRAAAADDITLTFVEPPDCPIDVRVRRAMERFGRVVPYDSPVDADGILTFSDAQLVDTAKRADLAGLRFHTLRSSELLANKAQQRAALTAAGLVQPSVVVAAGHAELLDALRHARPPVVVKPSRGTGSRLVSALRSRAEVDDYADNLALPADAYPFLVESQIVGMGHPRHSWLEDFVSVETASFNGAHEHFAVTGRLPLRPPLRETGSVFPAMLPQEVVGRVLSQTTQALNALGITDGVSHTELKLTADGPVIIEVNGRLGGAIDELQTLTAAYRPVRAALLIAAGCRPSAPSRPQGHAAVIWHHLDGTAPADSVFEKIRRANGVVRLQVPRDHTARVGEGRLATPVTVVVKTDSAEDLRAAVARCRNALGAEQNEA